jgi:deoxyribodipyrimidine photolyase-related protein
MSNIFLLFPIHLFKNIDLLHHKKIYLIEEPLYFIDYKYHKLKLAYHRATMKSYFNYLKSHKIDVKYIDYKDVSKAFYKSLISSKNSIYMYDSNDISLNSHIKNSIPNISINKTLNFLVNKELLTENLSEFYNGKKYNHQNFYKWQRIRLNILVEDGNKPIGGKWSYDQENRKKIPNNEKIPQIIKINQDKVSHNIISEAKIYIESNFPNNYGSLDNFIYPMNHNDSKKWLTFFLENKFEKFGIYEDAVSEKDPFLFHSILTPMMNIGLLTDEEVINETLKYQDKIPINSLEGFIRQIIGWRNYMYAIYLLDGAKLAKMNFFKSNNKLSIKNIKMLWEGTTNIPPIDDIIHKIEKYAYAHHIERLMYLGLFMMLCMIKPNDVYNMFMEWTIDAYEWVMIPNVYGMSQYADGGLIMTKPYIASSNYILKMSNYKKGEWCKIFDALYYNFINKHETYLSKNYSTSRQVAHWRKKSKKAKIELINIANNYLANTFIK